MRFVGQRVDAARIDPSIVEIEKRTHGDAEIDGFVVPTRGSQEIGILSRNSGGLTIHLVDEPEERLVFLVESGAI